MSSLPKNLNVKIGGCSDVAAKRALSANSTAWRPLTLYPLTLF